MNKTNTNGTRKARYTADVYFSHKGRCKPCLCQTITFNTARGAKTAFSNMMARMRDTLVYNYGYGAAIQVTARCRGAKVDLITYNHTT